jgi:hypothetical protein
LLQAAVRQGHAHPALAFFNGMFMSADEPMTPEEIAAEFNLPQRAGLVLLTSVP